jgi:hypothetical protein
MMQNMKAVVVIVVMLLLMAIGLHSGRVGAEQGYATVRVEKFDPPVVLNEYNQLVKLITVTNLPGAPGLVMHVPCIRSKISPNNAPWGGELVAPGVLEGCPPQLIPSGTAKGAYVNQDGEIFAGPPNS